MTNTEYLQRFALLPEGCHVLCALSGGRDSVYLLHRLLEWSGELNLTVSAAHFNHHLRQEESDRDEAFVRQLCRELKVPLYVAGGDVRSYGAQQGLGMEEAARTLRYAFLEETRQQIGADVIATAHHADDLAETMLFQLARGSGTTGLSGIPPRRGAVVRPILLTTRQEINAYLQLHRCAYVEDSSNELDHCSRNVIRHQVMPVLQSINPAFVSHAAQSAMLLREDDAYLNRLAEQFLEEHPIQQGLDADALLAAELPVAARVIRAVWGNGLSYGHIRQILELCKKDGLSYTHIPGGVVRCDGGKLWVHEERELPRAFPLEGDQGGAWFGSVRIRWKIGVYPGEIHNSLNTFSLKCENIKGILTVSAKQDGDRIQLAGTDHRKKLKQLYAQVKLPQPQRRENPVFRDAQGPVAVCGFGAAQRCVPEIGDRVIQIVCDQSTEKW